MSPEELQQLKEKVDRIDAGFRNLSQMDPQYFQVILDIAKKLKLTDISDVNTGAADGQVIKWNSTTSEWDPEDDIDT